MHRTLLLAMLAGSWISLGTVSMHAENMHQCFHRCNRVYAECIHRTDDFVVCGKQLSPCLAYCPSH